MTIKSLLDLVQPPLNPSATGDDEAWKKLERILDFPFPDEYKACINIYGSGTFSDTIILISPFEDHAYQDWIRTELEYYSSTREKFPELFQFSIYPSKGGLYPWAMTSSGEKIYWETLDIPDEWPIIAYSTRGPEFERWKLPVSEFLYKWISGTLDSKVLPTKGFENIFRSEDF